MRLVFVCCLLILCTIAPPAAQSDGPDAARRKAYDELLDLNVRDGLVYYRSKRSGRGSIGTSRRWRTCRSMRRRVTSGSRSG